MGNNNNDNSKGNGSRVTSLFKNVIKVFRHTIEGFTENRATESAAGTAFFTFFSLFPLLIFLVAVGSYFVDEELIQQEVLNLIQGIPISPAIIEENIMEVFRLREEATLISVIGLAWSATGAFTLLSHNINRAFPSADERGFIGARLTAFAMLVFLIVLLALSSVAMAILNVIRQISVPIFGYELLPDFIFDYFMTYAAPLILGVIIFMNLYRWVPAIRVSWRAAFTAGLVIAIAWELTTFGFVWYLSSGLASYRVIYGSLGTVVALMFWIYINFIIIYFGAHLAAAISAHHRSNQKEMRET